MIPGRALKDIAHGAPLDPAALLGPLGASPVSERARTNAELALALLAAGRAQEAEPFAERAWLLSGFSEAFLPRYVEIQKALGRIDRVRAAYRRAGINLAAAGKTEEAIALFSLSHSAQVHAGLGDRYEYDFEIQYAIENLARAHRPSQVDAAPERRSGTIRLAYLVFGAIHKGSVLVKLLCYFAEHHDRSRFDVGFFVPESPRTPRHSPYREELRSNVALLEAHGARVEAAQASTELDCWLETDRSIREFGADILVTTALLAHYSHFFIAAMRPARAVVGLGLGPPEQFAAPGLDWAICATRHPLMDMPCNASFVEMEPAMPKREALRPHPRSALDIPESAPLLVAAGRAQKFLDRGYWAALARILAENQEAWLLTLGPTQDPPFLGEVFTPEARRRYRRTGWVADYLPLLANADVVLDTYPSGGGFVLTDAMSLGIPVVGFRNDYLRPFDQTEWSTLEEFLTVEDLIVPRGDFAALRRVVGRLLADPAHRRDMGGRCRADLAAHRGNPARTVRRHENIYEAVAKKTVQRKIEPGLARPTPNEFSSSAPAALDFREGSVTPLVSIVIPVYNGADFLRQAIDSALAQTYPNVEVLVVNDGSTDGGATEAIARSYGERVRYFSKPNGHVASALNFGIARMRGSWFSWLSHDDLYKPDKIERQMRAVASLGPGTIVYSDFETLDESDGRITPVLLHSTPAEHFRWFLTTASSMHGCTLLIPKAGLDACGSFQETLRTTQDYDMWFRLARRCRFVHVPGIVVTARRHPGQGTIALRDVAIAECDRLLAGFVGELEAEELTAATGASLDRACLALARNLHARGFEGASAAALGRARRHRPASLSARLRFEFESRFPAAAPFLKNLLRPVWRAVVRRGARARFTNIYERNVFGGRESRSGEGSTLEQTATIARAIPLLVRELGARTFLDAPCGDVNWMRHVDLGVEKYIGVDVVGALVAANQSRFGGAGREFLCRDLVADPLPPADIVLCRDCLVHLTFRDAKKVIRNFRRSGCKYLLATTFTARDENADLTGGGVWRTLNLERPPFNLPPPLRLINERCTEGGGAYADKSLGLWRLEDLPVG